MQTLTELSERRNPPQPWTFAEKIPWNDPEFSARMLGNHLSQDHDWASRRGAVIDRQVSWLCGRLPRGGGRVLDIACGPGLYTQRLARLGHACVGVDFSPASIEYARAQARAENLSIEYVLADIRRMQVSGPFDLAMLTFGELNVFREADARQILRQAAALLRDGGWLVVEAHAFAEIERLGRVEPSWQTLRQGLFSDRPHLLLQENFWDEAGATATMRYFVVDAATAGVAEYRASMQAYQDAQYVDMLRAVGMDRIETLSADAWPTGDSFTGKLQVYACRCDHRPA